MFSIFPNTKFHISTKKSMKINKNASSFRVDPFCRADNGAENGDGDRLWTLNFGEQLHYHHFCAIPKDEDQNYDRHLPPLPMRPRRSRGVLPVAWSSSDPLRSAQKKLALHLPRLPHSVLPHIFLFLDDDHRADCLRLSGEEVEERGARHPLFCLSLRQLLCPLAFGSHYAPRQWIRHVRSGHRRHFRLV